MSGHPNPCLPGCSCPNAPALGASVAPAPVPGRPDLELAALRPLACTYCGGKLTVDTETKGRAYLTYEVPESITCDEIGCQAVWDADGAPRELPAFIQYPELYARPEATR